MKTPSHHIYKQWLYKKLDVGKGNELEKFSVAAYSYITINLYIF